MREGAISEVSAKPPSTQRRHAAAQAARRDYRLHGDEPADEGVRRIAQGRIDAALEQLRVDSKVDLATAVHDTRKDMKKLRSLLRLVRDELGDKRYRAENARYRDAARLLARSRDAEVKLATLTSLREHYGTSAPAAAGLVAALRLERQRLSTRAEGDELGERLEQAARAIEAGGAAIEDWPLKSHGWKLMRDGLEHGYRGGRKGLRQVRAAPTAEVVHDWRKRVKDLWYDLRLLGDMWPDAMKTSADQAHELADLLGDHHDLSVLAEEIRTRGNGHADSARLLELTERRQRELLELALPLGERLYAEQPKQFVARLRVYWRAWRLE
jgi:CHAD domain-containing protein